MHATALVGSAGIAAEAFLPEAMRLFTAVPDMIAAEVPAASVPGSTRASTRASKGASP